MTTPQDIIRAWCASCGMAEPSNGDVGALLLKLFPSMSVAQSLGEEPKYWCDTCEGTGEVYQEHQAGCWVGGDFPCPDCDGKGYWIPRGSKPSATTGAAS